MALRTPLTVSPHMYIGDSTGRPLDLGMVYFGQPDKDPQFYPIDIFSDDDLKVPVSQPVRTKGGYLNDNKGDMAEIHANELIYSVKVLDQYGRKIFYKGQSMRSNWNDDVIIRINEAVEQSQQIATNLAGDAIVVIKADAERQIASAISGVAIDANLVTDALIVAEGVTNQLTINRGFASVADMLALVNPPTGMRVYVKSYHAGLKKGGGYFVYDNARKLENDGGNILNGWIRETPAGEFRTYDYGAIGNGLLNNEEDARAFKRIETAIKATGDATLHIENGHYIVGTQALLQGVGIIEQQVFSIAYSTPQDKSLIIKSYDATLTLKDGMYYGVFNKNTFEPIQTTMPFHPSTPSYQPVKDVVTRPSVGYMIQVSNLSNLTMEGNLLLDGNIDGCILGGKYGDLDWQIGAQCLLVEHTKKFNIQDVTMVNGCQDGFYLSGFNTVAERDIHHPEWSGVVRNVKATRCARQNMTLAGGQNISFYDCYFDKAGVDTPFETMPKSCVDIEAEVRPVRNITFTKCFFGSGRSNSMVADAGDIKDVRFYNCDFINSVGNVSWVRKPRFLFSDCYFNGYMQGQYSSDVEVDRTVYRDCEFTDDPLRNPNYTTRDYLINVHGANPRFENCMISTYKSGFIITGGISNPKLLVDFNNCLWNVYGAKNNTSVKAIGYIRIRDYRPLAIRSPFSLTIDLNILGKGKLVIELMDDEPSQITSYSMPAEKVVGARSKYHPPVPKANSVANATAVDNTATQLNAVIAALKAANLMA